MKQYNILVTGGTGFIGSALVNSLLAKNYKVTVVDNLSTGKLENIDQYHSDPNFEFIRLDLLDYQKLTEVVNGFDIIFHLAANVDVRKGHLNTDADFLNNVVATRNVLESMRDSDKCKKIIFTSSSVVYGECPILPTPETYGPLVPISLYGASKLACEALISGYVGTFGIQGVILRLANIIGSPTGHGVIHDFIRKLKESNGKYLEILGDGQQKKSYLYIADCVCALIKGLNKFNSELEIFNVGSDDHIDTNTIAQIIINELKVNPKITYVSEVKDGRGWVGDVKVMLLSSDKLKKMGWQIKHSSKDTVTVTVKNIIEASKNQGSFLKT